MDKIITLKRKEFNPIIEQPIDLNFEFKKGKKDG